MDPAAHWTDWMGGAARAGYLSARAPTDTPAVAWATAAGSGLRSAPVLTDQVVLVASTDRTLRAFDRQSGTEFWGQRLGGTPGAPLLLGDRIYVGTEDGNEGEVRALRFRDGRTQWRRKVGPVPAPLAAAGDTLFGITSRGAAFALRTRDGREVWKTSLRVRGLVWGLVPGPDRVFAVSIGDTLFALDRGSGRLVGRAPLPGRVVGPPALAAGTLVVATAQGAAAAYAVSSDAPTLLWETAGFDPFVGGPVIVGDRALAVTEHGELVAFGLADGRHRVLARLEDAASAAPTAVENGVLVGTLTGRLYLLDLEGRLLWTKQLEGSITHPVAVTDFGIVVPMYGPVEGFLGSRPLRGKVVLLR